MYCTTVILKLGILQEHDQNSKFVEFVQENLSTFCHDFKLSKLGKEHWKSGERERGRTLRVHTLLYCSMRTEFKLTAIFFIEYCFTGKC